MGMPNFTGLPSLRGKWNIGEYSNTTTPLLSLCHAAVFYSMPLKQNNEVPAATLLRQFHDRLIGLRPPISKALLCGPSSAQAS